MDRQAARDSGTARQAHNGCRDNEFPSERWFYCNGHWWLNREPSSAQASDFRHPSHPRWPACQPSKRQSGAAWSAKTWSLRASCSTPRQPSTAWSAIEVICHEDLDTLAAPWIVPFVSTALAQSRDCYRKSICEARLMVGNAIRMIYRSPKSRAGCHFAAAIGCGRPAWRTAQNCGKSGPACPARGQDDGWKGARSGDLRFCCDLVHDHIQFGYEHDHAIMTSLEVFNESKGVCRDYAHLAITFCRCMNIPAGIFTMATGPGVAGPKRT